MELEYPGHGERQIVHGIGQVRRALGFAWLTEIADKHERTVEYSQQRRAFVLR